MRKALIAVCLAFALCLGGAAAAHVAVNEAKDQVVLTEKVLFGDKAHAEGLTILARAAVDGHLHWDTTYVVGEEPATRTEFRFTAESEYPVGTYQPGGLSNNDFLSNMGGDWTREGAELTGIQLAYQALYEQAEPGVEAETTVKVADYYDYYPVKLIVELPGFEYDIVWGGFRNAVDEVQRAEMESLDQALQDYIKVPILEGQTISIHLTKDAGGLARQWGSSTTGSDRYDLRFWNTLTDKACYFILDNKSYRGTKMDFSQVPGGYGIHILPFEIDAAGTTHVDAADLSMVYPLDEDSQVIWFTHTPDNSRLLLMTQEGDGACLLRVIDCADMSTIQELELYQVTQERGPWAELCQEGYLVLRTSDGGILLLEERADGGYDMAIDIVVANWEQVHAGIGTTLWDGERLVLADALMEHNDWDNDMSGFAVAVYDAGGALFGAKYTSSLDTKSYAYYENMNCSLLYDDPLELSWRD